MAIIKSPFDGYAGFNIDGKYIIIGAVKKDQEFDCIEGLQLVFEKTLADLNTSLTPLE
jgi:hypothetical protein